MGKTKISITEVLRSEDQETLREALQKIVDAYLRGAITSESASAHP